MLLRRQTLVAALYVVGGALLCTALGLWLIPRANDPQRVFWATIDQSLSTTAVTMQASQGSGTTKLQQTVQYSLGAQNLSRSLTTVTQGKTRIVNEMIATPKADYTRYLTIQTNQTKADGSKLDTSKLVGVWAKGDAQTSKLFAQAVLGTALPLGGVGVPIGNLGAAQRAAVITRMQHDMVYRVDFTKVAKRHQHGRPVYEYTVAVQPVAYAGMMKHFAELMGLDDLKNLDPNVYQGKESLQVQLRVDVRSRHIIEARVAGTDYSQSYSSYGVPVAISPPAHAISAGELQRRLSGLQ